MLNKILLTVNIMVSPHLGDISIIQISVIGHWSPGNNGQPD
jgi:hypothetical protein